MLIAPTAHAFCRTRTCEFRTDVDCEVDREGCSTVGEFVFWEDQCIPFAVQRDGSDDENISAAQLEMLVASGFQTWSREQCPGGGTPVLSAGSQGDIACDAVEYNCNDRAANSNIIMFRDTFANTRVGLRLGVIALTTLTANLVSGELFDADIEINSRDEDFEIDDSGDVGVNPDEARDLSGVVNHELGHLLGLSHTETEGALMRAAYEGTFMPADDDVAAICEALGRGATDPTCSVETLAASTECLGPDTSCPSQSNTTSDSNGCACELPSARRGVGVEGVAGSSAVALLGLALARRRSRRRQNA